MTNRDFISRMRQVCEAVRRRGGLFNESVVLAQAALESGWGKSALARTANNLFGLKAGQSWKGGVLELPTSEFDKKRGWYRTVARWRKYPSWEACLDDYCSLIARLPWFKDALDHVDDAERFLRALLPSENEPGWATDPGYYGKVKGVMETIERMEREQPA